MNFSIVNDGIKISIYKGYTQDGGEHIAYEDVSFNEISPDELENEIEKQKERITKELQNIWETGIAPYLGKPYDSANEEEIREAAHLASEYFHFVWDNLVVAGPYDSNPYAEELAEMARVVKTNKFDVPENYLVLGLPRIDYLVSCFDDSGEVEEISVVAEALRVEFLSEKEIFVLAAKQALYHKVSKVFFYDCDAIRDYISGDLTFKGFARRIDPREERGC